MSALSVKRIYMSSILKKIVHTQKHLPHFPDERSELREERVERGKLKLDRLKRPPVEARLVRRREELEVSASRSAGVTDCVDRERERRQTGSAERAMDSSFETDISFSKGFGDAVVDNRAL